MPEETFVAEFPPETTQVIDGLRKKLHIKDRAVVIQKALGLLQLWVEAQEQDRIIVERPRSGADEKEEFEIAVYGDIS